MGLELHCAHGVVRKAGLESGPERTAAATGPGPVSSTAGVGSSEVAARSVVSRHRALTLRCVSRRRKKRLHFGHCTRLAPGSYWGCFVR